MAIGTGSTLWAGLSVGALLAVGSGVLVFVLNRTDPADPPATDQVTQATPAETEEAEPEAPTTEVAVASPEPEADTTEPEVEEVAALPELVPPTFDIVRVAPDGATVIAGKSGSNYDVKVMIGETEMFSTRADGRGDFVAIFDVQATDFLKEVMLMGVSPDGREVRSEASIFLTPPVVAAAEPEKTIEPETPVQTALAETVETVEDKAADLSEAVSEAVTEEATTTAVAALTTTHSDTSAVEETSTEDAKIGDAIPAAPTTEVVAETTPAVVPDEPVINQDVVAETAAPAAPTAPTGSESSTPEIQVAALDQPEISVPRAPGVIIADETGIRVIQSPAPQVSPEALTNIVIDSISYDAKGDVAISGRARVGNYVRIYVDNQSILTESINGDGSWRAALPDVDSGVYTLRADEVDREGAVQSRVETPFQREDAEVLDKAVAEASQDGGSPITLVTVQPGFTLWGIAAQNYGDGMNYVRIFDANRDQIRNADLIYPGQIFSVPTQ